MLPTQEPDEYPDPGAPVGNTQIFVTVGGTTDVVALGAFDVVEVLIVVGVHKLTVVALAPFLEGDRDRKLLFLQLLPMQVSQYDLTSTHQLANSKHWSASGHEFVKKQSATWSRHEDTALPQDALSLKTGKGLEHHFPHAYSQVGTGAIDVHGATCVVEVINVVRDADEVVALDVILLLDLAPGVEVVALDVILLLDAAPLVEVVALDVMLLLDAAPGVEVAALVVMLLLDAAPGVEVAALEVLLLLDAAPGVEVVLLEVLLLLDAAPGVEVVLLEVLKTKVLVDEITTLVEELGDAMLDEAPIEVDLVVDTTADVTLVDEELFEIIMLEDEATGSVITVDEELFDVTLLDEEATEGVMLADEELFEVMLLNEEITGGVILVEEDATGVATLVEKVTTGGVTLAVEELLTLVLIDEETTGGVILLDEEL
ncbi:hypothetical protein MMC07_005995 [Pseudocyphellaria aurata]|nr:hypothetical protein [Pseudocyphellaria aurata]